MHISWVDSKMVYGTLDSVQNALQYSTEPTEFIFALNEQTLLDNNPKIPPNETWKEFMHHPIIPNCKIVKIDNKNELYGISKFCRDYYNKDGLTYWGECDCYVPAEFFYVNENFQRTHKERPYVLTFANRKMWPGWELIEHPEVVNRSLYESDSGYLDKNIIEQQFLRCDGPMSEKFLYKFNEQQGDPEIVLLSGQRIEGTLCTLSDGMPEKLLCPDNIFCHADYNLQLSMGFYHIPQYHVRNIIKGHDMFHPNKRSNMNVTASRSSNVQKQMDQDREVMLNWVHKLYQKDV